MNKKTFFSIAKILISAIFIISILTTVSQATTNGFTELVKSPSITIAKPSTTKLEAIKVTIKAPSTTKLKENKFYIDNKEITLKPSSNNDNSEMVYQIPKGSLPKKNKTKTIKVLSTATNSEIIYKVVNVTNKDGKYYVLSNAPSIKDINYTENNSQITISMKSTGKNLNAIEILDTNNNKIVYSNKKITDKTTEVKIDKNKLSINNEYYKIKISVSDKNGAYTVKNITFKLPATNIPCTHTNVIYTNITDTQHTKTCKDCGEILSTKAHMFSASTGKCKECGYECKHSNTKYLINTTTHQKICITCGMNWKEENHKTNSKKCTVCNLTKNDKLGLVSANISPTISNIHDNNKLADITITVKSSTKIKDVKIYETDANGNIQKDLNLTKTNDSTSKDIKYVLSNKNLLKGETHYFYITAQNKYGTTTRYYRIKKASKTKNNKNIEYYAINGSPRLALNSTTINKKLPLVLKDGSGLEYLKIYDMNNNNKLVSTKSGFSTTQQFLQINLNNYTAKDGSYKLKFEMKDISSSPKVATMIAKIDIEPKVTIKKGITPVANYQDYTRYTFTYNFDNATKIQVRCAQKDSEAAHKAFDNCLYKPSSDYRSIADIKLNNPNDKLTFYITVYYGIFQSEVRTITI